MARFRIHSLPDLLKLKSLGPLEYWTGYTVYIPSEAVVGSKGELFEDFLEMIFTSFLFSSRGSLLRKPVFGLANYLIGISY